MTAAASSGEVQVCCRGRQILRGTYDDEGERMQMSTWTTCRSGQLGSLGRGFDFPPALQVEHPSGGQWRGEGSCHSNRLAPPTHVTDLS